MESKIWSGSVAANLETGVKTGCHVNQGDIININASGSATYNGRNETGPSDADGDSKTQVSAQGVTANAVALLVRIDSKTFLAGKNLANWTVPVSGELVFLVNDKPRAYKDNKGAFEVTVTKVKNTTQTGNTGGVQDTTGSPLNTGNTGPGNEGSTTTQPLPGLPVNTQFTVTLINNEQWVRTATLNIDGEEHTMQVAGNQGICKAFTTKTGNVTIALVDSQHGSMRLSPNISVESLGSTGNSMTFGAEKIKDEDRPGYMDVFIHIDWATQINN